MVALSPATLPLAATTPQPINNSPGLSGLELAMPDSRSQWDSPGWSGQQARLTCWLYPPPSSEVGYPLYSAIQWCLLIMQVLFSLSSECVVWITQPANKAGRI